MFPYRSNGANMYQPTDGTQKPAYDEPDWCPAPSRPRPQQNPQIESRVDSWNNQKQTRGLFSNENRDVRSTTGSSYQYPGIRIHSPPRQRPREGCHINYNSKEVQSYLAAINSVNETVNANAKRSTVDSTLSGLWKVFDAAVLELGSELCDSLSNKAIFEACVKQDTLKMTGRRMNDLEKKADAEVRKAEYESVLKSTILRLRGSYADVLLAAKEEIKSSLEKQAKEIESNQDKQISDLVRSYERRAADAQRKALEVERSYEKRVENAERKAIELEISYEEAIAELQTSCSIKIEENKEESNTEIKRLHNELSKARLVVARVQHEMVEEKQGLELSIRVAEKARDDATQKLSSTIETLQATCHSAQSAGEKLRKTEDKLEELMATTKEMEEQSSLQQQRVELLQKKLDAEIKGKRKLEMTLGNETKNRYGLQQKVDKLGAELQSTCQKLEAEVMARNQLLKSKKEFEEHLSLERERGDLLQKELDKESRKIGQLQRELEHEVRQKQEVTRSSHDVDRNRRSEIDRANKENCQLRNRIGELSESLSTCKADLEASKAENSRILAKMKDLSHTLDDCENELKKAAQYSSSLSAKVARLESQVEDQDMELQAARLSEADVEASLNESLRKIQNLESEAKLLTEKLQEESKIKLDKIEELNEASKRIEDLERDGKSHAEEMKEQEKIHRSQSEAIAKLQKSNSGLEAERDALISQLEEIQQEYDEDRDKIANALVGFDEEMTNAETKLKSVLEELEITRKKVEELNGDKEEALKEIANGRKNLEECKVEFKKAEEGILALKNEFQKSQAEYDKDIEVYQETIRELQDQIGEDGRILPCPKCAQLEETRSHMKEVEEEVMSLKELLQTECVLREQNTKNLHETDKLKKELEKKVQELEVAKEKLQSECTEKGKKIEILNEATEKKAELEKKVQELEDAMEAQKKKIQEEDELLKEEKIKLERLFEENQLLKEEAVKKQIRDLEEKIATIKTENEAEKQKLIQDQERFVDEKKLLVAEKDTLEATKRSLLEENQNLEDEKKTLNARLHTQSMQHGSTLKLKDGEITALKEKCARREEALSKLEKMCSKARKDLVQLREQKKYLEGSLQRSLEFIQDLKSLKSVKERHSLNSPRKDVSYNNDIVADEEIDEIRSSMKQYNGKQEAGSELESLLACIERQIGCGENDNDATVQDQYTVSRNTRGGGGGDDSSYNFIISPTKSW